MTDRLTIQMSYSHKLPHEQEVSSLGGTYRMAADLALDVLNRAPPSISADCQITRRYQSFNSFQETQVTVQGLTPNEAISLIESVQTIPLRDFSREVQKNIPKDAKYTEKRGSRTKEAEDGWTLVSKDFEEKEG